MNHALQTAEDGARVTIPRHACYLSADVTLAELALQRHAPVASEVSDGKKSQGLFSMVALSGKPLQHWAYDMLGIDLAGVRMKQRLPVLKDHDTDQRLGYTTALRVEPGRGLIAEGRLLSHSAAAAEILADHREGFPWQASTYLEPHKVQRLGDGEVAELNGHQMTGPGVIFRECTLREVTFTALGVDDDTSATPLAANVAGEVVAVLSLRTNMTKQTTEAPASTVAAAAPVAPAVPATETVDATKLAADAAAAERKRANTILESAADVQLDLARKLVADGVALEDAMLQLNRDLVARLKAQRPVPSSTEALAAGNSASVAPKTASSKASKTSETDTEDPEVQWAESEQLRAEFSGDKNVWLAFHKNRHRCKSYGSLAAMEAAQADV